MFKLLQLALLSTFLLTANAQASFEDNSGSIGLSSPSKDPEALAPIKVTLQGEELSKVKQFFDILRNAGAKTEKISLYSDAVSTLITTTSSILVSFAFVDDDTIGVMNTLKVMIPLAIAARLASMKFKNFTSDSKSNELLALTGGTLGKGEEQTDENGKPILSKEAKNKKVSQWADVVGTGLLTIGTILVSFERPESWIFSTLKAVLPVGLSARLAAMRYQGEEYSQKLLNIVDIFLDSFQEKLGITNTATEATE